MTDLTTSDTTLSFCLSGGEWREVIVQEELIGALDQCFINNLLIAARTEGNGRERLCLTTGEDRTSVRAREVPHLTPDRTDLRSLTAIQTLSLIEDRATHSLFLYIVIVAIYERCHLIDVDA